jgi:cytoskeletal protein RodZ
MLAGPQERQTMTDQDKDPQQQPLTLREMLQSVLAAALGVQSGKNRSRDFSRGKPSHFILLGVLFTALFVVVLLGAVKLILHMATG